MQTISLTAGKHSAELFLVGAGEVESAHPRTGVHILITEPYPLGVVGYRFEHSLVRVYALMLLIHIGYLHRVAHVYGAGVRSVKSHNEPEERSLTCTVRAYHTHDACRWEHEIEVLEKEILSLQMKQFSEKLSKKGITFDEIEQAIEAGIFDKSENDKNCATNSTSETKEEDKPDEVSGS